MPLGAGCGEHLQDVPLNHQPLDQQQRPPANRTVTRSEAEEARAGASALDNTNCGRRPARIKALACAQSLLAAAFRPLG